MSAARRVLAVADALPVTVLAAIAGAGSFTHIRDAAAQHGQAWLGRTHVLGRRRLRPVN